MSQFREYKTLGLNICQSVENIRHDLKICHNLENMRRVLKIHNSLENIRHGVGEICHSLDTRRECLYQVEEHKTLGANVCHNWKNIRHTILILTRFVINMILTRFVINLNPELDRTSQSLERCYVLKKLHLTSISFTYEIFTLVIRV